jgi:DNA-binding beta-propeller fold protein YncE
LPDFSETFTTAVKLGSPRTEALYELHADGSAPTIIGPYVPGIGDTYNYAGASADGKIVAIEAGGKLPAKEGEAPIPGAKTGKPNVYTWDAASERLHLASVMNSEADSEALLPKGAFAGPYNWAPVDNVSLANGGAADRYYTQEERAVAEDGSVFFTAAGSGQLYERINPTQPQSAVAVNGEGEEECTEPAKACTLHVSASHRNPPDPIGAAPAAFMAATADGKTAYFTSSEELSEDANTGPVQPAPSIGAADLGAEDPQDTLQPGFIGGRALGLAISPDGEYVYWADPGRGTIGRARLEGEEAVEADPEYIVPGETSFETHPTLEPGVIHSAPSAPRYVAVDDEYVYWTNTGPLGGEDGGQSFERKIDGAGTIGRAKIGAGKGEDIDPDWIIGASNPQGIATNDEHVYWANAGNDEVSASAIARAEILGGGVEQHFLPMSFGRRADGLALSGTQIYFGATDEQGKGFGTIRRIPLDGGDEEAFTVSKSRVQSVAVDATHVYWASQSEEAIGRNLLTGFKPGGCEAIPGCGKEFLKPGGTPFGLAVDGERLLYSVNGDSPPNPGADLYRFQAPGTGTCPQGAGCLTDLTPDAAVPNGAEVQGVVGASADGSYLYFVANADLDGAGEAATGDCHSPIYASSGSCNLYLLHGGEISFIARLSKEGGFQGSDATDWAASEKESLNGSSRPKTALVSPDGRTLLFRSREKLTGYDNQGTPEYYRYRDGEISCPTCNPSGVAPSSGATIGSAAFPSAGPLAQAGSTSPRFLAADGERVFFQSTEALVAGDVNGLAGCPGVGSGSQNYPACQDVYEWEAPGAGSCEVGGPGYSPSNQGCLYLISTGKSPDPSFFADASESGEDVFFFTREQLVRQDTDQLVDVYDARVGGGLAAQNPQPRPPCEGDACKPPATPPPPYSAPPQFSGPPSPEPKRPRKGCAKAKGKKHCHKHGKKHRHRKTHHRHRGR